MLGFTVSFQEGVAKNQFLRKPAVIRTRRDESGISVGSKLEFPISLVKVNSSRTFVLKILFCSSSRQS